MSHAVLVTGAFGNIGSRTVRHLLSQGHRVVAVDLQTPKTEAVAATFGDTINILWGSICDRDIWATALEGIDTVVHMAAIIPPLSERNPKLAVAVNQTATFDLVDHMQKSATAKRLIFASSMTVAGHEQYLRAPPLSVDDQLKPTDLYGKTKAECEDYIRASTLQWSILRIAACPPSEVSFSSDTYAIEIIFESSPDGRIEVVHNDDAALAFANAVTCDAAIGKILFVGGGERCRTLALDFYNRVFAAMGIGPLRPEVFRPGPPYFFGDWLDTAESQKLLAFQRHTIDDICAELRSSAGFKRWLLKPIAPLVNRILERRSPYRTAAARSH